MVMGVGKNFRQPQEEFQISHEGIPNINLSQWASTEPKTMEKDLAAVHVVVVLVRHLPSNNQTRLMLQNKTWPKHVHKP